MKGEVASSGRSEKFVSTDSFRDELCSPRGARRRKRYTSARGRGREKKRKRVRGVHHSSTPTRWHVSGLMAAPVPPKHTALQSAARENVQGKDRPRKEYQSIVSSLCKHSRGWLSWNVNRPVRENRSSSRRCCHTAPRVCTLQPLFAFAFSSATPGKIGKQFL